MLFYLNNLLSIWSLDIIFIAHIFPQTTRGGTDVEGRQAHDIGASEAWGEGLWVELQVRQSGSWAEREAQPLTCVG